MPTEKRQRQRQNSQTRAAEARAAQRKAEQRRRFISAAVVVVIIVAVFAALTYFSGNSKSSSKVTAAPNSSTTVATNQGPTLCPKADGSSARRTSFPSSFPICIDVAKHYTATMTTDAGTLVIALDPTKAPQTVNNFVSLARFHFFDGLTFHRVIPDFVDQGGDPKGDGTGGPGYQFPDELPKPSDYKPGSVVMANSGPNTNGSQFFFVASDNGAKSLVSAAGGQAKYSLFGQITSGLDVAQKINADGTDAGTPKVLHKILTVTIAEA